MPHTETVQLMGGSFAHPDEIREFTDGTGRIEIVDLNGNPIGLGTFAPGWRWSENGRSLTGTDSCQAEHVGYVLEGRLAARMDDGAEHVFGPGEVFHIPPGHDSWTDGDVTCRVVDFGGLRGYAHSH